MAETTDTPTTIEQLNAQEEAELQAIRAAIEEERQKRLQAARGQAINRGLSGSSFEQRAISEVNRVMDQSLVENEKSIRGTYLNSRIQIEESERARLWQTLEQEKQNAFSAGENEKARLYEEEQARLQRASEEAQARMEANSNLIGQAAQLATVGLLTKGGEAGAATKTGTFSTALNKAGSIFGAGSNPVAGASGPALPTFSQGIFQPYSSGATPGGAGAVGQAVGSAAGTAGGAYAGQKVARSIFDDYSTDKSVSRGAKSGSLFGGTVGSYLGGPIGGVVGGTAGGTYGANAGKQLRGIADIGAGSSDNKGITLANVSEAIVKNPVKTTASIFNAATGAGAVQSAVKKIFCFLPDTPIEMVGDKAVPIGLLRLGDRTLGGEVISIRRAIADDLFSYGGIFVTGTHAIREDGTWIRVAESKKAVPILGRFEVVSIVTTGHRIYSKGITMADEVETEDYEDISITESLEALNRQEEAKRGA